ncbi:MAG: ABC transporter permease [Leucobacter sp.]
MTAALKENRARRWAGSGWGRRSARVLIAPVAGIALTIILIAGSGSPPIPVLYAGFEYALGGLEPIARTIAWGLPLYVVVLGVSVGLRSGMFTVGAEGQIYVGALVGALAGASIGGLAPVAHQAVAVSLAALAAGALSAGLGWLALRWGVDVILSSLLSNYILMYLCVFLAKGPFNDPLADAPGATHQILPGAQFPLLIPKTQLTAAIFVVGVLVLGIWWLVERSVAGYRFRMIGESRGFATAVGINVSRWQILAMAISGALCGVGGAIIVMASQGRFTSEIAIGLGWIAIMLALIARSRPGLAVVWVTVYSIMRSASRRIEQIADVPSELAVLVICVVLVAAAAAPQIVSMVSDEWKRRRHGMA